MIFLYMFAVLVIFMVLKHHDYFLCTDPAHSAPTHQSLANRIEDIKVDR